MNRDEERIKKEISRIAKEALDGVDKNGQEVMGDYEDIEIALENLVTDATTSCYQMTKYEQAALQMLVAQVSSTGKMPNRVDISDAAKASAYLFDAVFTAVYEQ